MLLLTLQPKTRLLLQLKQDLNNNIHLRKIIIITHEPIAIIFLTVTYVTETGGIVLLEETLDVLSHMRLRSSFIFTLAKQEYVCLLLRSKGNRAILSLLNKLCW